MQHTVMDHLSAMLNVARKLQRWKGFGHKAVDEYGVLWDRLGMAKTEVHGVQSEDVRQMP